ncbi:MAG: hypothetical protein ACRDD1_22575, partial [Planctomycetia bacterium]
LGFLGATVGAAETVERFTPERSWGTAVADLGSAFDAAALSLMLSLGLVLLHYLTKRAENRVLDEVEDRAGRLLRHRFIAADPTVQPYLAAVQAASETILSHTDGLVRRQVEMWSTAMANVERSAAAAQEKLQQRLEDVLRALHQEGRSQNAVQTATADRLEAVQAGLARTADSLDAVGRQSGVLTQLETQLAENLRLLRETQSFDDAMQSLTAAVHLLTLRAQPISRDRAA